jgi:PAS domain S-box-containing protein
MSASGERPVAPASARSVVFLAAGVALVYYAAAKLGLSVAFTTRQVTAVWPPTGVAVTALLLFGARAGPGIFAGALAANTGLGEPLSAAAGIAVGNTAMAVAALLLLRLAGFDQRLGRIRDVLGLVLAATLAAVVSASNGVAMLALHGLVHWAHYWSVWRVWWAGDSTGIILFAPLLLAWLSGQAPPSVGLRRRRWFLAEGGALFVALTVVSVLSLSSRWALASAGVPVRFLVIPLVIWAAARFGTRGATTSILVVAAVAAWGTIHALGRFASIPPDTRLAELGYYLGVLAATGLALNAIVIEREQARGDLERAAERGRANKRFRGLVESAPDAMVIVDTAGAIALVNVRAEALFGYSRDELTGRPVEILMPEKFRHAHLDHRHGFQPEIAGEPGCGPDAIGLARDGRHFPAEISLSPLDTPEGRLTCAAIRDVTQRRATEQSLRELAVIVQSSRDAILAKTLDGVITVWNPAAERVYGYPAAQAIGRNVEMLSPPDRREEARELLGRLACGEQIERFETVHVASSGRLLHVELTLWPVRGHTGEIIGASAISRDITGRKQRQDKLRLARRIGDDVTASLNPHLAARRLAAALVPALADAAAIDLAEAAENGSGEVLRRIAAEPPGQTHPELALAPTLAAATEQHAELPESLALSMPMRARGRVVGFMNLAQSVSGRTFTADDFAWAATLADRAGTAVDNGQLYEQQRNTALTLQRSLMGSPAAPAGLDTAARYLPAADGAGVGGDWFDMIPLDQGRIGVFIGDVMGRGLDAAAVMGQLRSAGRALAKAGLPPAKLMTVLDAVVADLPEQLVTCCYLVIDAASEDVTVCSAGHLPAMVVGPDAEVRRLTGPVNVPLGVAASAPEQTSVPLPGGSTLALYTDGLVESRGQDIEAQLGILADELAAAAAGALDLEQTADRVLSALLPGPDPYSDDVTLLLARVPRTPQELTTIQLPAEPAAAAAGRGFVAAALAAWGCTELVETARLLTSELVTNAVQHADGPLRLGLRRTASQVIVEVSDNSIMRPTVQPKDPTSESGRGLLLVDALSDTWGTRLDGSAKAVWFALRLAGNPPRT